MQQLGYSDAASCVIYWLLPGMNMDSGLRIVDCDTDTLSMIVVVPKFQYFQLFVDLKDMNFGSVSLDDVVIFGSPVLPKVFSPVKRMGKAAACRNNAGKSNARCSSSSVPQRQEADLGHEVRRSRRKLDVESDNSELDADYVDSDNDFSADDDDLYDEWVDEKFEEAKKNKYKWVDDSDYDTEDDLEELQDSDVEPANSAEEVEVIDKKGRKTIKKKV
jgi:hypothetical protein